MTGYPARASTIEVPFDLDIGSSESLRHRGGEHRPSPNVPAAANSGIVDATPIASTHLTLAGCPTANINLLSQGFEGDVPRNQSIKGTLGLVGTSKEYLEGRLQRAVRFYGMACIVDSLFRDSLTEIMQPAGPARPRPE